MLAGLGSSEASQTGTRSTGVRPWRQALTHHKVCLCAAPFSAHPTEATVTSPRGLASFPEASRASRPGFTPSCAAVCVSAPPPGFWPLSPRPAYQV